MKWIVSYNPYRNSMLILQQKRYHVKLFFTKKIHFVCLHKMYLRYPIYLIDNIGNEQKNDSLNAGTAVGMFAKK